MHYIVNIVYLVSISTEGTDNTIVKLSWGEAAVVISMQSIAAGEGLSMITRNMCVNKVFFRSIVN